MLFPLWKCEQRGTLYMFIFIETMKVNVTHCVNKIEIKQQYNRPTFCFLLTVFGSRREKMGDT
jgi:hypothetical protein